MAELLTGAVFGVIGLSVGLLVFGVRNRELSNRLNQALHRLGRSSSRNERLMRQNEALIGLLNQAAEGERIDSIKGPGGEAESFASSTDSVQIKVDSHRRAAGRSPRHDTTSNQRRRRAD